MRNIGKQLAISLLLAGLALAQSSPANSGEQQNAQPPAGTPQAQGGGIGATSNTTQVQTPNGPVGNAATATGTVDATPAQQPQQPAESQDPTGAQRQQEPVLKPRVPAPTHFPHATTVALGTEMHATLNTTLSSKTSHPGDTFTATLTEPLKNQDGSVLVPAGATIDGTVQEAESGRLLPSVRGKGRLTLRFQDVQLANGTHVPISATLIGMNDSFDKAGKATSTEEGQVTAKTSGTDTIKKVGIGAGVGTVAGMIFGSALKGLAIGAIAGGGYVLANAGKDVEIPAKTSLRLRLDQYLTVPAGQVNAQQ